EDILDIDGAFLATDRSYYTAYTDGGPGAVGQLRNVHRSDGSWVFYTYDDLGRRASVVRPCKDGLLPATDPPLPTFSRTTTYSYVPQTSADDIPSNQTFPRLCP